MNEIQNLVFSAYYNISEIANTYKRHL